MKMVCYTPCVTVAEKLSSDEGIEPVPLDADAAI
jgi:hypothetical protein